MFFYASSFCGFAQTKNSPNIPYLKDVHVVLKDSDGNVVGTCDTTPTGGVLPNSTGTVNVCSLPIEKAGTYTITYTHPDFWPVTFTKVVQDVECGQTIYVNQKMYPKKVRINYIFYICCGQSTQSKDCGPNDDIQVQATVDGREVSFHEVRTI